MSELTNSAVTEKIVQALATYLKRDPSTITESHHLRDDLGLDSVAVIELLFEIEERFKLQIPDQDLPGLSTVGSVAAYVQRRLAEPQQETPTPASAPAKPARAKASKSASKATPKSTTSKSGTKKPAAKPVATKKPNAASPGVPTKKKKVGTR